MARSVQAEFLCEELSETTFSQPWNRLRAMQAQLEATSKRLTTENATNTVDGRNPKQPPNNDDYPIIYRVLGYIPGGCLGFLNHQQY